MEWWGFSSLWDVGVRGRQAEDDFQVSGLSYRKGGGAIDRAGEEQGGSRFGEEECVPFSAYYV